MIETFVVYHDADVTEIAKEHQRAEFELIFLCRLGKGGPVRARGSALKINANVLKSPPHQSRTIEFFGARAIEMIGGAYMRLDRREQRFVEGVRQVDRRRQRHPGRRRRRQRGRTGNSWPLLFKHDRLCFQSYRAFWVN